MTSPLGRLFRDKPTVESQSRIAESVKSAFLSTEKDYT